MSRWAVHLHGKHSRLHVHYNEWGLKSETEYSQETNRKELNNHRMVTTTVMLRGVTNLKDVNVCKENLWLYMLQPQYQRQILDLHFCKNFQVKIIIVTGCCRTATRRDMRTNKIVMSMALSWGDVLCYGLTSPRFQRLFCQFNLSFRLAFLIVFSHNCVPKVDNIDDIFHSFGMDTTEFNLIRIPMLHGTVQMYYTLLRNLHVIIRVVNNQISFHGHKTSDGNLLQ